MRGQSDFGASTFPPAAKPALSRWAVVGALIGVLVGSGCDKAVCEGVDGSCLALHVDGAGSYDLLEGVLMSASGMVLKTGDAATAVTLPVAVQILPPPGLSTALAASLRVNGYRGTTLVAEGMVTLSWPDGARIDAKLALIDVPETTTSDMAKSAKTD